MSLAERYLNITTSYNDVFELFDEELCENIRGYQYNYVMNKNDPETLKKNVISKLYAHIDLIYTNINIEGVDINYYLEHINQESNKKFVDILNLLNLNYIILIMDYGLVNNCNDNCNDNCNNNYIYFRNEYFKYFNSKIVNNKYKIGKSNKLEKLDELVDNNWSNINFENLINFTTTLNRMKYYSQDITVFAKIFENKFNSKDNIDKLIVYITQNFIEENETNDFNDPVEQTDKKFNFRYRF